jgi:hypothetical protein
MTEDSSFWETIFTGTFLFLWIAWIVLILVAGWKMYVKAGQPGWTSLIPFVNFFALLKIIHKPWWWFLLLFVPFVNIVIWILMYNGLSKAFGRGLGTTLGLIFFTPITYLILGFGDAQYELEEDPLFG